MVENTGTALATGLIDAKATDDQRQKRVRELATAGSEHPESLKPEEIRELCSAVLQSLPEPEA